MDPDPQDPWDCRIDTVSQSNLRTNEAVFEARFSDEKWLLCSISAVFYELFSSHWVFVASHKTHIEDKVPPARLGLGNTVLRTVGDVAYIHGEM